MQLDNLSGTATESDDIILIPFPELRQVYHYDCVACALTCVLAANNINVREDEVIRIAKTTEKDGTDPPGVFEVLEHFGLKYRAGSMAIQDIKSAIKNGHPVLLMLQAYRDNPTIPYQDCWDDGHGVVCIGCGDGKFVFEDPASYTRTWLSEDELLTRWHDTDVNGTRLLSWGCEILQRPQFESGKIVRME